MTNKLLGYLFTLVGLASLALTTEIVKKNIPVKIPSQITNLYLIIGGGVLVIIGILLMKTSGGSYRNRKGIEVPIYQGKNIVGYRKS